LGAFLPAFSQDLSDIEEFIGEEEEDLGIIASSKDSKVILYGSSHIGYGFHAMNSSIFEPGASGEVFANILRLGIYPAEHLAVELNLDIEHNDFRSKETSFSLENGYIVLPKDGTAPSEGEAKGKKNVSSFNYWNVNLPLLVKFRARDFHIGAGAEGSINFAGKVWSRYTQGRRTTKVSETGARLNLFTYGIVGVISYDGLTLFLKWYPKSSRIVSQGDVDFSHMTVGLSFGL
jgi:hypothetical protein